MRREPDLEMRASVRAAEVRLEVKPEINVVAYSESPATAEWGSQRENLPDELECGKTYRDFCIGWRAVAWLEEEPGP
jgi:hypothetical protein